MAWTDRDVLVALYRSTDGRAWVDRDVLLSLHGWTDVQRQWRQSNWNTDAHLSFWCGVNVNAHRCVVKLSLSNNNLRGKDVVEPLYNPSPLKQKIGFFFSRRLGLVSFDGFIH